MDGIGKIERILALYTKFINGGIVNKSEEAIQYGVNERSIQRDIEDIRNYMAQSMVETGIANSIVYDRTYKGYRLEQMYRSKLTNSEILAICKILLESRAFPKKEMEMLLNKLMDNSVPKVNEKIIREMISNEAFHYMEPRHRKKNFDILWEIARSIHERLYIEIKYQGVRGTTQKTRKLVPLAIMFSEYYFYLTAFIQDESVRENFTVKNDAYPTIYRIDRIQGLKVLDEHYRIPYANRFEEGEFRKRIQFMYGGKLRKIKFKYTGYSVDSILDRLPTARIISEERIDHLIIKYTIIAEVFGDGIDMWIRSQGDTVEVIE